MGECTKTCGGGIRTNTRDQKDAEHGGDECQGVSSVTESCNVEECPGKMGYITLIFMV